ncbi:MAG: hypothetical protein WKF40_01270 [Thermoleophilaceae bacterium]
MADERLRRWAAERVRELLARAEEEALAEARTLLRDALVEAALEHGEASAPGAGRRDAPREPPQREPPPGERRQPPRSGPQSPAARRNGCTRSARVAPAPIRSRSPAWPMPRCIR